LSQSANSIRKKYEDQLPKRSKFDFIIFIGLFASVVTILSPLSGIWDILFAPAPANLPEIISVSALVFLLALCIIYIAYREISAKHRFSEYVIYSHYVNHISRDYMNAPDEKKESSVILEDITDKVAEIFSITCGKKCYCTIKSVTDNSEVYELFTDRLSSADKTPIPINKFSSLLSIIDGKTPRYYICDDVFGAFKLHKYKHPKLEDYQLENSIWGKRGWPLQFKSTLVLPIRYFDNDNMETPQYLGFLCVDCKSKNAFDHRYHPEMAAAFADLIYILLSVTDSKN